VSLEHPGHREIGKATARLEFCSGIVDIAPLDKTHFRRQVVIERAIVDFACVATRTIVEVDGDQHGHDRALAYDAKRTRELEEVGWRVLRFSNRQVMLELDSVLETVLAAVEGLLETR